MGHSDLHQGLRTPRAAAMAGIVFSVLSITSHVLVWISIPANLGGPAMDVISHSKTISLALNLLRSPALLSCGSLPWYAIA